MRIIDLALKDWQQLVRDKKALLFLVAMPIMFTVFMGIMLTPPAKDSDPRLPIGFINQDQSGTLGADFRSLLESSEAVKPIEVEQNDATLGGEQVRDGKLAALVIVPDRFSVALLAGEAAQAIVIVDTAQQAGQTANSALSTATNRLMSAIEAARLSSTNHPENFDAALQAAVAAWQKPPIGVTVETMNAPKEDKNPALGGFAQSSPGMLVQFTIFGLTTTATILVIERKSRTLQRMLTTSMRRWEIIAGHLLAMFTVVLLQQTLLVVFAQVFLNVNYLAQPLATLLVMVSLGLWIAALGLFIGTIAKSEEQAVMWSLLAMFALTALAGAWFPLDITGQAFNTIGHLTPGAWAMDGFQNIVLRGLGFASVVVPALVLWGFAALFFGLAVWRFKFE
jgi:ABC-2 type transport system permease protein